MSGLPKPIQDTSAQAVYAHVLQIVHRCEDRDTAAEVSKLCRAIRSCGRVDALLVGQQVLEKGGGHQTALASCDFLDSSQLNQEERTITLNIPTTLPLCLKVGISLVVPLYFL